MKPCFTRKNRCPAAKGRHASFHQAIRCPQRKVHNPPTTAWTLRDGHRITSRFTSIGNHTCVYYTYIYVYLVTSRDDDLYIILYNLYIYLLFYLSTDLSVYLLLCLFINSFNDQVSFFFKTLPRRIVLGRE